MMDAFVIKTKRTSESSSVDNVKSTAQQKDKRTRVAVDFSDELIGDPGKRLPINSYPFNMRDSMRRRYLARGPSQPSGHNFPKQNDGRKFQVKWYKNFPWLEYSVSKDAAFCLHCYLFASGNKSGDSAFTEIGFSNWKKALYSYNLHEGGTTSSHHYAKQKIVQYQNQRENVDHVLASKCSVMEAEYRIRLTAVARVIRLLLQGGSPFRGHDESAESEHPGNFLLHMNFYCEIDEEIKKAMDNAPGNNKLTSGKIQKQIIDACASETRKLILNEIGDRFFSLLVDEARDCSVKEQMAVVLRFINDNGEVIERFLGLVHVSNTSALCLKKAIDDLFAENGLSYARLRGQGYDGASNMRGKFNGLKALILNENKHAHYIHCFAHQLQLVVISAAKKCKPVRLFFDLVHMLVNIVGVSCKRKDTLLELHHDKVAEQVEKGEISTGKGKNQEINLTRPGDTRWGSHYKTIVRLFQMWDSVIDVLRIISNDSEENSQATADGLVVKMFDFEFVLVGKLVVRLLGFTNGLSQVLQTKNQNIVHAIGMVGVVKSGLKAYKEDGWEELLKEVTEFCEANNIHVPNMEDIIQSRARQLLDGVQMTYLHRFRRDIFLEAVNAIISEMDSRFSESTCELLLCISCLDPSDSFARFDRDRLLHLAKLYSEDFSSCEIVELDHQLSLYIHDMKSNTSFSGLSNIGELAKKMVEAKYHIFYRLVYRLVELALVIPVTTATVERCFSAMNIVKTDLRNRMDDDYLSDCLLCYIESTTFKSVELEDILQNFQNSASRRQDLPDISDKVSSTSVVNR